MTVIAKALFQETTLTTSDVTQYTAPVVTRTYIDKLSVTNTTAGALTVTVNLVPSGGSVATGNVIVSAQTVAAGATYTFPEVVGQILNPGDFLSAKASATGMNLRGSGREMT